MTIQLANHDHEEQLRDLLRGCPMPGWVRLAFGREPDFFQGLSVQGKTNQTLIALERGRVVGMGCRSIKPMLINGERMDFGYLSGLRLHPDVRRTGLLARGYGALRRLHEASPAPAYLTTVIEENAAARSLLTSGRAGLPHYLDMGRYITYAVSMNQNYRRSVSPFVMRRGDEVGIERLLRFLGDSGRARQFFPAIDASDFGSDYLRGLDPADFRVALNSSGEIIGAAAAWDQNAFKQNIVRGYAAPLRFLRPLVNAWLWLEGLRPLPPIGKNLASIHIAFPCVRGDDPQVLLALLERIYTEYLNSPYHYLLLGLHERDPLAAAVRKLKAATYQYVSRLYLVCWDDGLDFMKGLDPMRIPHLELATL